MKIREHDLKPVVNKDLSKRIRTVDWPSTDSKVMDRLILYLRIVFSFDFYNRNEYACEDEMPNRCGLLHVRPIPKGEENSDKEVTEYIQKLEDKVAVFMKDRVEIKADLLTKLGMRNEHDEIEKFMSASMQEVESDKWLCTLSQKKFKAPEFVRKHIQNKYGEKMEEVKMEVEYFNNYIKDENRPKLPAPTPAPMRRPQPEKRP